MSTFFGTPCLSSHQLHPILRFLFAPIRRSPFIIIITRLHSLESRSRPGLEDLNNDHDQPLIQQLPTSWSQSSRQVADDQPLIHHQHHDHHQHHGHNHHTRLHSLEVAPGLAQHHLPPKQDTRCISSSAHLCLAYFVVNVVVVIIIYVSPSSSEHHPIIQL